MPQKSDFEEQAYINEERRRVVNAARFIDKLLDKGDAMGVTLLKIDIAGPAKTGDQYRAILKGRDERGGLWVEFVYGDSYVELTQNIQRKGEKVGFKWREDKPYTPSP